MEQVAYYVHEEPYEKDDENTGKDDKSDSRYEVDDK